MSRGNTVLEVNYPAKMCLIASFIGRNADSFRFNVKSSRATTPFSYPSNSSIYGITRSACHVVYVAVTCPDLKNPSNGIVDYSSNVYQSEARYHCNLGYSLIGESSRICQSSGQWTTSQPSCQRMLSLSNF